MMNRLFYSGLSLLFLLAVGQSKATALTMSTTSSNPIIGNTVDVELNVADLDDGTADSVGAYDVNIAFDPSILSYNSVTFGNQLDLGIFGSIKSVDDSGIATGTLNIAESSLEDPVVLDSSQAPDFTLATITFDTIAVGPSQITPSIVSFGDAAGDPLAVDTLSSGTVAVAVPFGVSTNTGIIILAGIYGVNYLRKKLA